MKIQTIWKEVHKKIKGSLTIAKENGMVVEEGVTVMGDVNFGSEPYLITLRKKCRITNGVIFITHDGATWAFRHRWPEYADVIKFGRIEVGEESFIGARSVILPGVKIGKNCVVGAGSVVTSDVQDETVVCGVPARPVCSIKEYAEKCRATMDTMIPNFDKDLYNQNKKAYLLENIK